VVGGEERLHRPEVPELVETVRMRQAARVVDELNPLLLRARDGDRPASELPTRIQPLCRGIRR